MTVIDSFHMLLQKKIRAYISDERAGVTVEFVLWIPVFLIILALTVDVSMMFLRQANIWYVARDTARQLSIRALTADENCENKNTTDSADKYAQDRGSFAGDTPDVYTCVVPVNSLVYVQIEVPIDTVGVFGVFQIGSGSNLKASVAQRLEPN